MTENKSSIHSKRDLEITATFPAIGLNREVPNVDSKDIRDNETAFNMLLHKVAEADELYSEKVRETKDLTKKLELANKRIVALERRSSERFSAVLIATVAEIVTSIGVSIMSPSDNKIIPGVVIFAGVLMTGVSLWLNFKPESKANNENDQLG